MDEILAKMTCMTNKVVSYRQIITHFVTNMGRNGPDTNISAFSRTQNVQNLHNSM